MIQMIPDGDHATRIWWWVPHVGIHNVHLSSVSFRPTVPTAASLSCLVVLKLSLKWLTKGVVRDMDLSLCIYHKGIAQEESP